MPVSAQQVQQLKRSKGVFLFKEFKDAKVLRPFGKYVTAKANIHIENGDLCFVEDSVVKFAYMKGVLGVEFADTLKFRPVEGHMARVLKEQGYNALLCLTKVDKALMGQENEMANLQDMKLVSNAVDFNTRDEDVGYPLQNEYYFYVKGRVVEANETAFKKAMAPSQKDNFKSMMKNRLWSWNDPQSLMMLLPLLPQ